MNERVSLHVIDLSPREYQTKMIKTRMKVFRKRRAVNAF